MPQVIPPQPKVKTKAKKRYLKAKKERRKKRKTESGPKEKPESDVGITSISQLSENEHHQYEREVAEHGIETDVPAHVEPAKETSNCRPRKRRRLSPGETALEDEEVADHSGVLYTKSPSPPATLPLFPLPRRPDAPSKMTLAFQGLDKALTQAEFVDGNRVISISPLSDSGDVINLSKKTRKRLGELGISELFAVQTAVIPFLLSDDKQKSLYIPYSPPRDLCVSAPTGSGKTLAYVLPIVEILSPRTVTRLRALVVLPTRDLVTQVRETFEAVAKGRGLKIGTATGQHSFAHEQAQLVTDQSVDLQGGSSKVDVLVCTPGRLMDHLTGTRNFSLQHLRFLVIDEADRLLAQSFQEWLAQVQVATQSKPGFERGTPIYTSQQPCGECLGRSSDQLPFPDAISAAYLQPPQNCITTLTDIDEKTHSSCQKLLFSATLTRDPAKISALGLRDPKYFVVRTMVDPSGHGEEILDLLMENFSMPVTLTEHMVICEVAQKPLILLHLIRSFGVTNALVFTKSAESTTRLVRLLEFFDSSRIPNDNKSPMVTKAYSSDLSAGDRNVILDKFKNQEIQILVCSDLISRGIDISHVSHVVSYDAPVDFRKYVHRVGRTARAGRAGDAWTLVEEQEAWFFKSMLRTAGHLDSVKRLRVSEKDTALLLPPYQAALQKLGELYSR